MDKIKDRLITWSILVVLMVISITPGFAQTATVDITGNLVNNTQTATSAVSTWQNAKFVNELTCWQAGDPNCSPGTPYIRPDGSINFSYSFTELYQVVNVSKALPNSGTGLITTGFNFSWRSKVGNGWDDGRQDELKAYVQGYTKSGQWIENFNYNLNFIHDWTDFSWNENWTKPRRPTDLANVIFGFAGKDNNYWMGPYGPEITNVSFQLKYKPDPCVNNPLYSPECPKFQETIQKITETTTSTDTTQKTTLLSQEPNQQISFGENKPPPPPREDKEVEQLFDREPGAYESGSTVDLDRLIDTLIKIDDNQQREQKLSLEAASTAINETEKTIQQVVRQAEQVAAKSARLSNETNSLAQQNINVETNKDSKAQQSLTLFQNSNTSIQGAVQLQNNQQQFTVLQSPNSQENSLVINNNQEKINKPYVAQGSILLLNQPNTQQAVVTQASNQQATTFYQQQISATTLTSTVSLNSFTVGQGVETPSQQSNFLTNKTDPINQILDSKPTIEENKSDIKTTAVKQNVENNSVAGNISISTIAVIPNGFNAYSIALADASFYQPKEIYRNQRTVDNRRALQNLRSDQLHEQMINQQWR